MDNNFDNLLNVSAVPQDDRTAAFIAESKNNRSRCYEMSEQMTAAVATDGRVFQQYLDVQSRFDRYTANNALLILAQKPDAQKLGDYGYWRDQGAFVKRTERSNPVLIMEPGKEYEREDGSIGTALAADGIYAITSKASRKEGAWEFLEYFLQQDNDRYSFGFPARKAKLEEKAKEAVTVEYWTDENGDPILDENGDPYEIGVGGGISYQDGWSYTYRRATQAEVDLVLQLINQAKPVNLGIMQILEMINEDAAGYFEGQKSVDEVAKVIQNRVQLYVDVNN